MRRLAKAVTTLFFLSLLLNAASGQNSSRGQEEETCSEPIYSPKEVSRKAKLTDVPAPEYTEEARAKHVRGTVVLTAVLCRTGKVVDIKVIKGLPYGLTEKAIESTRRITSEPAEKDGEKVSQSLRRECNFILF